MSIGKISVIIPVYNASEFIESAVSSVIQFEEVREILLIEDGSKDNSLEICKKIEERYEKVKLITHPENKNLGAGATRNAGIRVATSEWISFLDADDLYLSNRFDFERKTIFNLMYDNTIDGVYGCTGLHYYNETNKDNYSNFVKGKATTVNMTIPSEDLKYALTETHTRYKGHFHLNSLTVKKEAVLKVNCFNEFLLLHQDFDFIIRLSFKSKLLTGIYDTPISSRGVHQNNRITYVSEKWGYKYYYNRFLQWGELENWLKDNKIYDDIICPYISKKTRTYKFLIKEKKRKFIQSIKFFINNEDIFFTYGMSDIIIKDIFNNEMVGALLVKIKEKFSLLFLKGKIKRYNKKKSN